MLEFLKNPAKWQSQFKSLKPSTKLTISLLAAAVFIVLVSLLNRSTESPSNGSMFSFGLDVFLKLGIVIIIIYIAAYLLRRFGVAGLKQKTKHLSISETLPLSAKRTLYIVKVDDQQLLIGATDQTISVLKTLSPETDKPEVISYISTSDQFTSEQFTEPINLQQKNN